MNIQAIKFTCPRCNQAAETNAFVERGGFATTCPHCRTFLFVDEKDVTK